MAKPRHWLFLIILAATWGSSFILIKRGLFTAEGAPLFSSIEVGALRIVLAAIFMLPVVVHRTALLKNGKLIFFLLVGLCGNAIPAFLFAKAQTEIPSALSGMLNALVPVFSLLIAFFVFRVRVRPLQVVGIFIGLVSSIGLILGAGGQISGSFNILYCLFVVLATLCYAISLNIIKQFLQEAPSIAITGLALVLVSPAGIAVLLSSGFIQKLQVVDQIWQGFAAISILAVIGTALALILFNTLVKETNTLFASSVTYLIPLVAILWGLADGETLTAVQIVSSLTMLGGIFLINRG